MTPWALAKSYDYHYVEVDNNPPGYSSSYSGYYKGPYDAKYADKNLVYSWQYSKYYDISIR